MGLPVRFIPHAIHIKDKASVDAWINQLRGVTTDQGISLFEESAGSQAAREFVAIKGVEPTIAIPTSDLNFLSTCGMSGLHIQPDTSKPGLVVYGRELPLGALPTAIGTAHHLKVTVSNGVLVPMSIQASHNTVAQLALMLHAYLGDDDLSLDDPMLMEVAQAIVTGAAGIANIYTAGLMLINSGVVHGIIEQNVTFGLQVFKESTDGETHITHVSIIAQEPKIEFSTRDVEFAETVGEGLALTAWGCYFRAVDENGQRIDPATESHLGITGTLGMITPGALTLTHKSAGAAAFTITPELDDTEILAIVVGAAMPG